MIEFSTAAHEITNLLVYICKMLFHIAQVSQFYFTKITNDLFKMFHNKKNNFNFCLFILKQNLLIDVVPSESSPFRQFVSFELQSIEVHVASGSFSCHSSPSIKDFALLNNVLAWIFQRIFSLFR